MNKNQIISTVLFCAALGVSPARADIKIGVQVNTTGSESAFGIDMGNAIKLAVEQLNAKGGILGQKIVTIDGDDGCDPQMATAAASKLASSDVVAVVGGYCSGAGLPSLKIYNDAGHIPFILCSANSSKFITQNPGNGFLVMALSIHEADTAVDLFKKQGAKTLALVHQGDAFSEDLAGSTRTRWEGMGRKVVAYDMIARGEQDMSSLVTRMKDINPDMIFYTGYYSEGGLFVKQLRQGGYHGKITVSDAATDVKFIQIGGKATEGIWAPSSPLPEFLPKGKDFNAQYRAKYHREPGPFSTLSYDGMMLLNDAIIRAKSFDHDKIIAALKATKAYPGLAGPISFDEHNDLAQSNFILLQVKNGKWDLYK